MSLLNLHWYTRNFPYRGAPDKLEYTGQSFIAFYNGFLDCSTDCPRAYDPIRIYGYTFCCNNLKAMLVWVEQGSKLKPKVKSDAVTVFYDDRGPQGKFITFPGRECEPSLEFDYELTEYQFSLSNSSEFVSHEGFPLTDTTFWDFENVCQQELTNYEGFAVIRRYLEYENNTYRATPWRHLTGYPLVFDGDIPTYEVKEISAKINFFVDNGHIGFTTLLSGGVGVPLTIGTGMKFPRPNFTGSYEAPYTNCWTNNDYGQQNGVLSSALYGLSPSVGRRGFLNGSTFTPFEEFRIINWDEAREDYTWTYDNRLGTTTIANNSKVVYSVYQIGVYKDGNVTKIITLRAPDGNYYACSEAPITSVPQNKRVCIDLTIKLGVEIPIAVIVFTRKGQVESRLPINLSLQIPLYTQEIACFEVNAIEAILIAIAAPYLEELSFELGDLLIQLTGPIGVSLSSVIDIGLEVRFVDP